jgi:hypothetical protein
MIKPDDRSDAKEYIDDPQIDAKIAYVKRIKK